MCYLMTAISYLVAAVFYLSFSVYYLMTWMCDLTASGILSPGSKYHLIIYWSQ